MAATSSETSRYLQEVVDPLLRPMIKELVRRKPRGAQAIASTIAELAAAAAAAVDLPPDMQMFVKYSGIWDAMRHDSVDYEEKMQACMQSLLFHSEANPVPMELFYVKLATYGKLCLPGKKHGFPFPTTPDLLEQMGTEFLSKAFNTAVTGYTVETTDTLEGNGMVSAMVHGNVDMADGSTKQVVYKFGPTSFQSRIVCDLFCLSETEFIFYSELRDLVPLRVPELHYGDFNDESKNVLLIMEKITGARFRDFIKEPWTTMDDASICIGQLAKFHARWLHKQDATELRNFMAHDSPVYEAFEPEAIKHWKNMSVKAFNGVEKERFTYELTAELVDTIADMCANVNGLTKYLYKVKETAGFTHGDSRLDNWFFFVDEDGNATAGLLDWQVCARSCVLCDLPWMILGSTSPELAREHGSSFFAMYMDALQAEMGDTQLDRALWEEMYLLSYVFNIVKWVLAGGGLDPKSPGMVDTINVYMTGCVDALGQLPIAEAWAKYKKGELVGQELA